MPDCLLVALCHLPAALCHLQLNQLNTELLLMGELHEKYQQRLAETTDQQSTELANLRTGFEAATADNNGLTITSICIINSRAAASSHFRMTNKSN